MDLSNLLEQNYELFKLPPLICIQILACMYLKHVFQVTYHNDFGVGKDKRFLISSGISGNNLGQIEKHYR